MLLLQFSKAGAVALNEPSLENYGEQGCRNCFQLINVTGEKLLVTTDREKIIQLLTTVPIVGSLLRLQSFLMKVFYLDIQEN